MSESQPPRTVPNDWRPALGAHYRLQWEPAQDSHVLLYPEGMVRLNMSSGEIMGLCNGERSVANIVETLQEKFADAGDLGPDIHDFLFEARARGWLRDN